jgi:hypothetical protein
MPEGTESGAQGATPTDPSSTSTTPAPPAAPEPATGNEPLGEGGIRALEAERTARRELEGQLTQIREGLARAFGGNPDPKASTDDVIAGLSQQVADLRHGALVERVARTHGITEDGDIDFLRSATDEDAMTRLAARLAARASAEPEPPAPTPPIGQGFRTPAPADPGPGIPRLRSAYEESK